MTGQELTRIIDDELRERGMTQKEFCAKLGIGSSAYSAWRKGSMPSVKRLKEIEAFLGLEFPAEATQTAVDPEIMFLLETLEQRQDLRILLHSARNVPPSSIYELISKLEKQREDARKHDSTD